jgi:hypothetical protein
MAREKDMVLEVRGDKGRNAKDSAVRAEKIPTVTL